MPTNVNVTGMQTVQPASRTAETKTEQIAVNKDGSSSSGFAKGTDVKFSTSVDNMSAVLEKLSGSKLSTETVLPKQLQQMINNVVKNAFSLDSSLGQGLGSAMSSERYSIDQLTTLSRIFQQMASSANTSAVNTGTLSADTKAGELTQQLQTLMTSLANFISNGKLAGNGANLELVQLSKAAFQFLNDGGIENLPQDLVQLLQGLAAQGSNAAGNVQQAQGSEQLTAFKQLIDALFPKPLVNTSTNTAGNAGTANMPGQQTTQGNTALNQTGGSQNINLSGQETMGEALSGSRQSGNITNPNNSNMNGNTGNMVGVRGNMPGMSAQGQEPMTLGQLLQDGKGNVQQPGQNAGTQAGQNNGNTAAPQNLGQAAGQNQLPNMQQGLKGAEVTAAAKNLNAGAEELPGNQAKAAANEQTAQGQQVKGDMSGRTQNQTLNAALNKAAEIENNPLFRQIFSRYGFSQETGVVRQQPQQNQQPAPELANNQQTVNAFKDMAQLLLKDSTLTAKDSQLLQNFVNGNQDMLSQQDAKQLNLLLRLVQSNIPAAVQQAGQQQGMEGLPKLWAFVQLAELGGLKDIKTKDLKNANKEIKTMVASMKGTVTSEGSYKADGQKSISFVMPLYIGENEQSYPAYINIFDEPPHEDETGRMRKDTWFRVCVLTENIGAVDIVCQLFEGNNLNLRLRFSQQETVKEFSEYLPEVRKALYDTSIHLNDIRVGTVN